MEVSKPRTETCGGSSRERIHEEEDQRLFPFPRSMEASSPYPGILIRSLFLTSPTLRGITILNEDFGDPVPGVLDAAVAFWIQ